VVNLTAYRIHYTETSKESHDGICIDYRPIDHNLYNDK
jgi:hypothetical protein